MTNLKVIYRTHIFSNCSDYLERIPGNKTRDECKIPILVKCWGHALVEHVLFKMVTFSAQYNQFQIEITLLTSGFKSSSE